MVLPPHHPRMTETEVNITIAGFTHSVIPKSHEKLKFEPIQEVHKKLNQNATNKLCCAYGNTLCLLGLTITPAQYQLLAGQPFTMPTPPVPPNLNAFATVHQSNEAIHQ
eukprot:13787375-Ditylum_brightwellii.AAC.2